MSSSESGDDGEGRPLSDRAREWVFRLYFAHLVSEVPVEALLFQVEKAFVVDDAEWSALELATRPYVPDPKLGQIPRGVWSRIEAEVGVALKAISSSRSELELAIQQASKRWRLERMPPVDRALLTVGCYELLDRRSVPARRIINRTVELAKHYGEADTRRFVNGILDQIRKDHGIEGG